MLYIKIIYELYFIIFTDFFKIVEKKSITKASQELHLIQPVVSIQLKNFQRRVNFEINFNTFLNSNYCRYNYFHYFK